MAFFPPNSHNTTTTTFMFHPQLEDHHDSSLPSTSLNSFPSLPPPQHFLGVAPFMLKRSMSFSGMGNKCEELVPVGGGYGEEELWEEAGLVQYGEKKKRLKVEQVKTLERSFERGKKLEGERKVELARSLGLQPRQIAIWFQNRRARWKTKQLQKDFESLKNLFQAAKADHHALLAHNHKLQAQLQALKSMDYCEGGTLISLKQETDQGSWSNGSDNSNNNTSDNIINLDLSRAQVTNTSPVYNSENGKSLESTSTTQLLQHSSSRQDNIEDEGFCNMFHHNIDEQQNLWPWPEQHHFH